MFTCADLASRSLAPDGCASVSAFTRCTQRCRSSLSIEYDQDGCRQEPSKQCEVREVKLFGGDYCMQNSPYYLDWEPANDGSGTGTRMFKCNRGTYYVGPQPRQRNFDDLVKQCDHVRRLKSIKKAKHIVGNNPCNDNTSSLENSKYCVPGRPGFNFSFILNNTRCFGETPGFCDSVGRNYPQDETECYTNPGDNDGNQFLCYYSGGSLGHEITYESYGIDTVSYGEERFNRYGDAESCLLANTPNQCDLYYEAVQEGSPFLYKMCGLVGGSCATIGSVDCAPPPPPSLPSPLSPPPSLPPPSLPPTPSLPQPQQPSSSVALIVGVGVGGASLAAAALFVILVVL